MVGEAFWGSFNFVILNNTHTENWLRLTLLVERKGNFGKQLLIGHMNVQI